jgi:hypothetical protein
MMNSSDDFGLTISGNPLNAAKVKEIHGKIEKLHKKRQTDALKTDPNAVVVEDIAQKRLAF